MNFSVPLKKIKLKKIHNSSCLLLSSVNELDGNGQNTENIVDSGIYKAYELHSFRSLLFIFAASKCFEKKNLFYFHV